MIRENENKHAKTKSHKAIRLARKFRDLERKRLKDNLDKFHYEIQDNDIIKVKENI